MTCSKASMRFACQNQSIHCMFNVKRRDIMYSLQHVCCITGQHYTPALLFRSFVTISDTLEKIHGIICMSAYLGNQGTTSPKYKQLIRELQDRNMDIFPTLYTSQQQLGPMLKRVGLVANAATTNGVCLLVLGGFLRVFIFKIFFGGWSFLGLRKMQALLFYFRVSYLKN